MPDLHFPMFHTQRRLMRALDDDDLWQIAFGGSRGGGKSEGSRQAMLIRRLKFPGTNGLLLRQTIKAVVDNHEQQFIDLFKAKGIRYTYRIKERQFRLWNGSEIHLGYAQKEADIDLYQGNEYMDIAFDEATQFKERVFQLLCGSNRPSKDIPGGRPKVWLTCNPGGIGTGWVKREFVKNKSNPHRLFIPSKLSDNVVLGRRDPEYAQRLTEGLPEWKRLQWLEGNWDVLEGQYFQLLDEHSQYGPTVREVDVPFWARWYAGVDWGYWPSAFAVLWAARWRDHRGYDHLHFTHELKRHRLDLDTQAQEALAVEQTIRLPVKIRYADPATEKKRESESDEAGPTIAQTWSRHKLFTVPASTRARVPGWMLMRVLMSRGILTIDPSLMAFITEITEAIYDTDGDKVVSDDIDPRVEDHCLDSARYLCVSTFGLEYLRSAQRLPPPEVVAA